MLHEEHLALSCANVSLPSHYVTSVIDCKAGFVNENIWSLLIFANQKLNISFFISIKDAHNFLNFESSSRIIVQFWHQISVWSKLAPIKSHIAMTVEKWAIRITKESLDWNLATQLINSHSLSHASLETERVFVIVVEESSEQLIRIKVEFFNKVRVRYVSCLIQFSSSKCYFTTFGEKNVTRGRIDAISELIYRQITPIFAEFLACFLVYGHD